MCQKQTSWSIDQGLTSRSSTADSFEDEALEDAANRALLCEEGLPCTISQECALGAPHRRSYDPALPCCLELSLSGLIG